MESLKLAVTGHRRLPHAQSIWVKAELRSWLARAVDKAGVDQITVISGMALGVDTWWAEIALDVGVTLHAYIPFEHQHGWTQVDGGKWLKLHDRAWIESQRDRHGLILDQADVVLDCSTSFGSGLQTPGALLHHRSKCMVRDCHYLGAVWNRRPRGGTTQCLKYSLAMGRRTYCINPKTKTTKWGMWTLENISRNRSSSPTRTNS